MSLEPLIQFDQQATLWVNSLHSPFTDNVWMLLSDVRIWFPAYAFVAFMLFRKLGWKKGLVFLVALILTVVLTDQFSNLVKNSVMRLRPCYTAAMLEGGLWCPLPRRGMYGFFSGHACNAFAFAAASSMAFRKRAYTVGVFCWAALVALSRVFMAMHYLGDILVGALVGLAVGFAMGWLARLAGDAWEARGREAQ